MAQEHFGVNLLSSMPITFVTVEGRSLLEARRSVLPRHS
jgi:hypothetical protein